MRHIRGRTWWIIGSVIFALLIVGCFRSQPKERLERLAVIDALGRSVVNAWVEFRSYDGESPIRLQTDLRGEVFPLLEPGVYWVEVTDGLFQLLEVFTFEGITSVEVTLDSFEKPGKVGVVTRADSTGLKSFLTGDASVLTTRMVLQGGDWEQISGLFRVSGMSEGSMPPGCSYWIWIPMLSDSTGILEIPLHEEPIILSVESFDTDGKSIYRSGSFPQEDVSPLRVSRAVFPEDALRKVGDLCADFQNTPGYDGKVNVWDLIFLLKRYGTNDPDADIGRMGTTVSMPPQRPFSTNADEPACGPDGKVDVWDLILLLNAYGASINQINTPFAPELVRAQFAFNQVELDWQMPHPNDCHESFVIFETDHPGGFLPRYSDRLREVPRRPIPEGTYHATVNTSKDYLLVYAYNPAGEEMYFSQPLIVARDKLSLSVEASPSSAGKVRIGAAEWSTFQIAHFDSGEQVTVEAMLDLDLEEPYDLFLGWFENEFQLTDHESYTFELATSRELVAKFDKSVEPSFYRMTVESDGGVGGRVRVIVNGNPSDLEIYHSIEIPEGAQVTLEAVAK